MQKPLPKSRPSRCIDYFRAREGAFRDALSDSRSSEHADEQSLDALMREMGRLTVSARLSGAQALHAKGLSSSAPARVCLAAKHVRLYRPAWSLAWVDEAPSFADDGVARNVSEVLRAKVFNWLMEIFLQYRLSRAAYFRATALFDAHAQASERPLADGEVELWGLAALFLAVKYEEEGGARLSLAHLAHFARGKYSAEAFAVAEEALFARLGHRVGFPTLLDLLDELMFRAELRFDGSERLRAVAECVLIRCLLHPHMLKTRPDLFCGAALVYTIRLFYEHYRACLTAARRPFNRHELRFKEEYFVDAVAKLTRLNKCMLLSVCEEVQELVDDFDDYREKCALHHIARLGDLDALTR